MNEKFFKGRAKAVRDIAEMADPFTKKRLLDLAKRYDAGKLTPRQKPRPTVSVRQEADYQDGGGDPG